MGRPRAATLLFVAANPRLQDRLHLDLEAREIQAALRPSGAAFDVQQRPAARTDELRQALLDCRPTYLHFCGHGAGEKGIALQDRSVDAESLAELFSLFGDTLRCVVLNACYSSVQAEIIGRYVDYVVGMGGEIADSAAIEFAKGFYDGIGAGLPVEDAFRLGRNAIRMKGLPDHLMPVLGGRKVPAPHAEAEPLQAPSTPALVVESSAAVLPRLHDWDGAPAVSVLFGREAAAERLRTWILEDLCKLILITGLGGIGKTDFVTFVARGGAANGTSRLVTTGVQQHFECVVWRSLLNAPRPQDFLADLLSVVSEHRVGSRSAVERQVEEVLSVLAERQCLLILDNIEMILRPSDARMSYREGYEAYGAFLEQVARRDHRSCLLLTSREKPRTVADLEGTRRRVRSLALDGLDTSGARELFAQIGSFEGSDEEWDRVVHIYRGNPLALELAARHIEDVFGGSLRAFLGDGRAVFSDISELLDWHLGRLAPKEREIAELLAIDREPRTLASLSEDMISPRSRREAPSTLQSLQRRIPLERVPGGRFALQPVLIEHITSRLVERLALELTGAEPTRSNGAADDDSASGSFPTLNSYGLSKASAKHHIREWQGRLILDPVLEWLIAESREKAVGERLLSLLSEWRRTHSATPGYLAGNVVTLLMHAGCDLRGADLSHLRIWETRFEEAILHDANFSFSEFHRCSFKYTFGNIYALAYSPSGELLAVGDDNGDVRLMRVTDGEEVIRCIGHADVISFVAFRPDGGLIASSSYDGTVRLWDAASGTLVNVLLGHESWVYSLSFSVDGRSIASASEDGSVRVWEVATGRCLLVMQVDSAFVARVAFSPDGRYLACAGSAQRIEVFNADDFAKVVTLEGHRNRIRALAFSPDSRLLATGGEDALIHLWRPDEGAHPVATLRDHFGSIIDLQFHPGGEILGSSSDDRTVRLWSTAELRCLGVIDASDSRVWSVGFSPNGSTFATGSDDSAVRIWDFKSHHCLMSFRGYGNKVWSMAFAPDGRTLVSGTEDHLVRVWDLDTSEIDAELAGHESRIWAVAISPDAKWIGSVSDDLSVIVWDTIRRTVRYRWKGHRDWIRTIDFSPDRELVASGGEDDLVVVWSLSSGRPVATIPCHLRRVLSLRFVGGGAQIAVCGAMPTIRLFTTATGEEVGALSGHTATVRSIAVAEDGRWLVSGGEDGTVRVWDIEELAEKRLFDIETSVAAVAVVANRYIVAGGDDGLIRVWDLDGRATSEFQAHDRALVAISSSPAERILATSSDDGAIRLWRLGAEGRLRVGKILRAPRPYEGMNLTGASGLTASTRKALASLGAIELPSTD